MNRRQASKLETRQLILSAARELFLEKGVERCTMRGIAKKAGVSPASVIVHFKNKTALLEVALYEEILATVNRAVASLPENGHFLARILHIPRAMYQFYDTDRPLYRALLRSTLLEPQEDNPYLSRQLFEYLEFLAGMVEGEKDGDNIRADIDAMTAAMSLSAMYFGVLSMFFRTPEMTPEMALNLLRTMIQQYLTGISNCPR